MKIKVEYAGVTAYGWPPRDGRKMRDRLTSMLVEFAEDAALTSPDGYGFASIFFRRSRWTACADRQKEVSFSVIK
jgi:hypothetical protein